MLKKPIALFAWLQLIRLPNLPSALTNIIAGACFAFTDQTLPWLTLLATAGASLCIYTAGLVWNDIVDINVDKHTRPNRPLPSGDILLSAAIRFAVLLLLLGLALLPLTTKISAYCLLSIVLVAFCYNFFLKQSAVFGPVALAYCRAVNLLAGYFVFASSEFTTTLLWVVISCALYIMLLSYIARMEDSTIQVWVIYVCLSLLLPVLLFLGWLIGTWLGGILLGSFSLGILLYCISVKQWDFAHVRHLVGSLLMGIYILDTAIASTVLGLFALFIFVCWPMATILRKKISPT